MTSNPVHGVDALLRGAQLLTRKELRPFIIVPLLINLVLFIGLSILMISQFGDLVSYLGSLLSDTPVDTSDMSWWKAIMAKGASWAAGAFQWLAWLIALAVLSWCTATSSASSPTLLPRPSMAFLPRKWKNC
jgi:CysZ protein